MGNAKSMLVLVLLVMVGTALAVQAGQTVLKHDPRFEQRRVVAGQRTELLFEGFEDTVPPAGWTIMSSGQSYPWSQHELSYSGEHSARVSHGAVGSWADEWLITPTLDTSGLSELFVEFYETGYNWPYRGHMHEVLISTTVPDDPAAFTPVWQVTPSDYEAPWLNTIGGEWGHVQFGIADYIGDTIYIAIRYSGSYADDWWIDDFHVYEPGAHDVQAISAAPDGQVFLAGSEIAPQFTVKNVGENVETFAAEMSIEYDGAPFYTETVTVESLAIGDQTTVDFPTFTCAVGVYDLSCTALLGTDVDPSNNTATASNGCYSGQRTPFGILYTNWACVPCVPANQAMDDWYPTQGNDACVMRVHVFWPGYYDPIFQANIEQNTFLHEMCPTFVGGVPTLYMDNIVDMWDHEQDNWTDTIVYGYDWSSNTGAPLEMQLIYDQSSSVAHVSIDVLDPMPPADYVLYVAVTEDSVEAEGVNGERYHNQAFRWMYPDTTGIPIETTLGIQEHSVELELDPDWVFEKLRAAAWVQEVPGGVVQNSATLWLSDSVAGVDEPGETLQPATRLVGACPNPFNPRTTIRFKLADKQAVRLAVFDVSGRMVTELANDVFTAGEHTATWNGKDLSGHDVSSGIYLIHMETEDQVRTGKMVLIR